eukprot:144068-Rhodomonas_salina.1
MIPSLGSSSGRAPRLPPPPPPPPPPHDASPRNLGLSAMPSLLIEMRLSARSVASRLPPVCPVTLAPAAVMRRE